MADKLIRTTTSQMKPGVSTTVTWKLKNWNKCSELLVQRANCILECPGIGGIANDSSMIKLRFKLREWADRSSKYINGVYLTHKNTFCALILEISSECHQKPVSIKVRALDTANGLDTGEMSFTLWNNEEVMVDKYFIYVRRLEEGPRGHKFVDLLRNYNGTTILDKNTQELNILIKVTMFRLQPEVQENSASTAVADPAFVLPKQQKLNEFSVFLEDNNFWDVKLKMSDKILLHAHRIILASRSSVFKARLTSDMKESREEIIEIPDIAAEAMKIILRHIYTREVVEMNINGDEELLKQVVYGASKYNLPHLLHHFDKMIIKVVNFGNAWELLKLAKMHNMPRASQDLENFVKKNCLEIMKQNMGTT